MLGIQDLPKTEIRSRLADENFKFSNGGLDRILKTSPKIKRYGERDRTRYGLVETAVAASA